MPRYFFDFEDGDFVADDVGTELPDVDSARREAAFFLGEFAREVLQKENTLEVMVHVREGGGPVLFTARLVYETGEPAPDD